MYIYVDLISYIQVDSYILCHNIIIIIIIMKLFLKLLIPWFWKSREPFYTGEPCHWPGLELGSGFTGIEQPAHLWRWRLWGGRGAAWMSQKMSSTHSQPRKVDLGAD